MRNLLARIRKLLGLGPKAQRLTERLLVIVPEFTLSLETPEGTTTDEDVIGRFDEAMRASEEVSGSTAILDHGAGTISSTFQVKAPTLEVAQMIATRVFADALRSAGLKGDSLWRIVEADEEPEWPRSDLQAQRRSEVFKAVRTDIRASRVPASGQGASRQRVGSAAPRQEPWARRARWPVGGCGIRPPGVRSGRVHEVRGHASAEGSDSPRTLGLVLERVSIRTLPLANRAADYAPMAPACCNTCRVCATTNTVGLAFAGATVFAGLVGRFSRRVFRR